MHSQDETSSASASSTLLTLLVVLICTNMACGTLGSYSSGPIPRRLAPERSVLAIEIIERAPIRFIKSNPARVYFVRFDEEGDLLTQEDIVPSNSKQGSYLYLVNARPGRYAAVATWNRTVSAPPPPPQSSAPPETTVSTHRTFYSEELVRVTEVEVPPSSFVFAGTIEVNVSVGISKADTVQKHFIELVNPAENPSFIERVLTKNMDFMQRGSLHEVRRDRETELEFLNNALEQFEGTEWIDLIRARIAELSGSPVP